ncbi:MAG: hypothetical protein ABI597_13195 [Gammaproteobacteria bacterium]
MKSRNSHNSTSSISASLSNKEVRIENVFSKEVNPLEFHRSQLDALLEAAITTSENPTPIELLITGLTSYGLSSEMKNILCALNKGATDLTQAHMYNNLNNLHNLIQDCYGIGTIRIAEIFSSAENNWKKSKSLTETQANNLKNPNNFIKYVIKMLRQYEQAKRPEIQEHLQKSLIQAKIEVSGRQTKQIFSKTRNRPKFTPDGTHSFSFQIGPEGYQFQAKKNIRVNNSGSLLSFFYQKRRFHPYGTQSKEQTTAKRENILSYTF